MNDTRNKTIGVVGAGLVGSLAALAFAKEGYKVQVFESRPDIRSEEQRKLANFRSINLAVSARGITALESVDKEVAARVLKDIIPMHGRMVHDVDGNQTSQAYGLYGEAINSIDRAILNRTLLEEVEKAGIEVFFEHKLVRADLKTPELTFDVKGESKTVAVDVVVGADGSYSRVRDQLQRVVRMDYSQKYIPHLYLELRIPAGENGKFSMDPNHLHIWPRHEFMLIGLANNDGSFTSTLFAPESLFNQLDTDEKILALFEEKFKDALELIGKDALLECFHKNPRGALISVKCNPYHFEDKAIIIGDAAHSMVPFYGQGMNCGLEDVKVLMKILKENNHDFKATFANYTDTRHEDLAAIIKLAMNNYVEMRHSVTSRLYLMRKTLDGFLSRWLGDRWLPLYTMVSFRADIPYSQAVATEARQKHILTTVINRTLQLTAVGSIIAIILARKYR